MATTLSLPPLRVHLGSLEVGRDGKYTGKVLIEPPWARFVEQLYSRSGGHEAPTNTDLDTEWQSALMFEASPAALVELNKKLDAIAVALEMIPNYQAEIAELRKQLEALSVNEAFA